MNKLTNEQLEILKSNSAYTLPDNPSQQGWSAGRIKEKMWKPSQLLFNWLSAIQQDGIDDKNALATFIANLASGAVVANKAKYDENGKVIANKEWTDEQYYTKSYLNGVVAGLLTKLDSLDDKDSDILTIIATKNSEMDSKKLNRSQSDTAFKLKVDQMDDSNSAVTNKGYVDTKVANAISNSTKEHIVSISTTKDTTNGTYTIILTKSDGTKLQTTFDTPDEKIIDTVTISGTTLNFKWINGQTTPVDMTSFMNVYTGSTGQDVSISVDDNGVIHATFSSTLTAYIEDFKSKKDVWESNENRRSELETAMTTLKTQMETIKDNLQPAVNLFGSNAYLTQAQYDALTDKSGVHFVEIE